MAGLAITEPPHGNPPPPPKGRAQADSSAISPTLPQLQVLLPEGRRSESGEVRGVSGESGRGTSGGGVRLQRERAAAVLSAQVLVQHGRWEERAETS